MERWTKGAEIPIAVGDSVVTLGMYGNATVYVAEKVTAKTFSYRRDANHYRPSEITRRDRSDVVFSGAPQIADRLCEQLRSSYAQMSAEHQAANVRRRERDTRFQANAFAALARARGEQP